MPKCNFITSPDERWEPVVGYEKLYAVSTLGHVISLRNGLLTQRRRDRKSHFYLEVELNKGGVSKRFTVHKLVLTAFRGPRPPGQECRHLDGNPCNNELANLVWGARPALTRREGVTLYELKRVLRYDPHTGHFYWVCERGSNAHSGDIAGYVAKDGYVGIEHAGRRYMAHRLAWWFMTGTLPPRPLVVEHCNSNKTDNRWANLFLVTNAKNCQNPNDRLQKNNRSGSRGVGMRADGNWRARIMVGGRSICRGSYVDLEQAIAARKAAERLYFTGHSEALDRKLRAVLGDHYVLRQVPVVAVSAPAA